MKKLLLLVDLWKKKVSNYHSLKIKNKIKFVKLNVNNKKQIDKIIEKYSPKKIFYFSGQSSITKRTQKLNYIFQHNFLGLINDCSKSI